MKILSWNVRRLGSWVKRAIIKESVQRNKIDLLLIQESKLRTVSNSIVKEVWGSSTTDWCCRDVVGAAGGIIVIWSSRALSQKDQWIGTFSVSVLLEDMSNHFVWL